MNRYLQTVMEQDAERKRFNERLPQARKALDIMMQEEKLVKCNVELYHEEDVIKTKKRIERILTIATTVAFLGMAWMIFSYISTFVIASSLRHYAELSALIGLSVFLLAGILIAMPLLSVKDDIISFRKRPVMTVGEAIKKIIDDAGNSVDNSYGSQV